MPQKSAFVFIQNKYVKQTELKRATKQDAVTQKQNKRAYEEE